MWKVIRRNPVAAGLALLLHIAILVLLLVGFDWLEKPKQAPRQVEVVQARIVDQAKIDAERQRQEKEAERKQAQALKRKQEAETKRQAAVEKKRQVAEAKRKAETEKKRKAEAEKKRKAEAEKKRKVEAEKKRKAEAEKKRKAEAAKQRKAAEVKRKAEAEKKRKAEAEKKRKAAEAKRKAAEAKRRAEQQAREAALRERMAAEQSAREIDKYTIAIRQQIQRNWLRPPGASEGLVCTLRVRLIPGGEVIAVSILKGSGDAAFDRSVETAVRKASPLPVPSGALFESFRSLELKFDPN